MNHAGIQIQCYGCGAFSRAPANWVNGPHLWKCPQCGFTHEVSFGSLGATFVACKPVDRFAVPAGALLALSVSHQRIVADILEGIRAANAGCTRAGVVMLRRALERACKVAGAQDRTLAGKIDQLKAKGMLSPVQASTAHAIRAFANVYGAHPDDDVLDEVSDDEIDAAVKLTVAVVNGLVRSRK